MQSHIHKHNFGKRMFYCKWNKLCIEVAKNAFKNLFWNSYQSVAHLWPNLNVTCAQGRDHLIFSRAGARWLQQLVVIVSVFLRFLKGCPAPWWSFRVSTPFSLLCLILLNDFHKNASVRPNTLIIWVLHSLLENKLKTILQIESFNVGLQTYSFAQFRAHFSFGDIISRGGSNLKLFPLATVSTNENSVFLFINQFGCTSTPFWRCSLKSVRRKALRWISYFTPNASMRYWLTNINQISTTTTLTAMHAARIFSMGVNT